MDLKANALYEIVVVYWIWSCKRTTCLMAWSLKSLTQLDIQPCHTNATTVAVTLQSGSNSPLFINLYQQPLRSREHPL